MSNSNYLKDLDLSILVENKEFGSHNVNYEASVIIVTYNPEKKLLECCLNSLKNQTYKNFETILVDNSDKNKIEDFISKYNLKYIKLARNYGLSLARNVGIYFARGNLLIFLDDDAIPAKNWVEGHLHAHKRYNIYGLRGKCLPRTSKFLNYLATGYDLGNQVIPFYINLEGNSSFKKEILIEVGGFKPELQNAGGGEGLELTYRILTKYRDRNKIIYYPNAIIYHDFFITFRKYLKKILRHARYAEILENQYQDINKFAKSYYFDSRTVKGKLDFRLRGTIYIIQKLVLFVLLARKAVIKCLNKLSII